MAKFLLLFLLCFGCSISSFSVDLDSTFVVDSSFTEDEQHAIVQSLYDWEQVTRGKVNMKLIITDTPNLYGPLPKIIKSSEPPDDTTYGYTKYDADHMTIYIYFKNIEASRFVSTKAVVLHEMGHTFGLAHSNRGLMVPINVNQTCIDDFALKQFCEVHYCSIDEVKSNCPDDIDI